jgi:hypothetical protein
MIAEKKWVLGNGKFGHRDPFVKKRRIAHPPLNFNGKR